MKIVHIIPELSYGGSTKICIMLCNFFAQNHEVTLICLSNHTPSMFPLELIDKRVNFITLGKRPGLDTRLFIRLFRILKMISPDIINAHHASLLYTALYIQLNVATKIFYTIHSFAQADAPGVYEIFYKLLFTTRKIRLISNSYAVLSTIQETYRKSIKSNIYLGIDWPIFSQRKLEVKSKIDSFKRDTQTKVLINVARVSPEKNHQLLIRAFSQLINEGYNVILIVIGNSKHETDLLELQKISPPSVHFLGFKDNVMDYLSASDLFCLTSHYEGLSLAIIEAMAIGVLPICTPVGGIPEVIRDGYNGILSDDCTVKAYTQALKRYFSLDNETKNKMCQNAFNTYKDRFTIERCGEEYLNLYSK